MANETVSSLMEELLQEEGGSNASYIKRVSLETERRGFPRTPHYVKKVYYSKKSWTTREQKLNARGEVISERRVLEAPAVDIPDSLRIKALTHYTATNAQWVKYYDKGEEPHESKLELFKYLETLPPPPPRNIILNEADELLMLVFSDAHIGMNPNKNSYDMFKRSWKRDDIMRMADKMIAQTVRRCKAFDYERIDVVDLGDFLDGWEGKTTRGGHELPQTMSSRDAHAVAAEFKLTLLNEIQCRTNLHVNSINLCNDNHSGTFAWVVNKYVESQIQKSNQRVDFQVIERFIHHYFYGDNTIVLTHGKDEFENKFAPFGVAPNPKSAKLISDYMAEFKLSGRVQLFKGDTHRLNIDMHSVTDLNYYAALALCPSNTWSQNNFGTGRSGFMLTGISKDASSVDMKIIENLKRD